jgi:hypothetical protein
MVVRIVLYFLRFLLLIYMFVDIEIMDENKNIKFEYSVLLTVLAASNAGLFFR